MAVLDPSGGSSITATAGESSVAVGTRIENALARAVKQNAVRTMDIFRDWDANNDGTISKAEFRKALRALGVDGNKEAHDALFDEWDVDSSGQLDFKELDKALRKAQGKLGDLKVCAPHHSIGRMAHPCSRLSGERREDDLLCACEHAW